MKNILNKLLVAAFLFTQLAHAGTFSVDQLQANGVTAPTLTSTVATGTPPLTVTSTTPVPNLTVTNAINLTGSGAVSSATTATTQAIGTSNTSIATTAFVNPGSSLAANGYIEFPNGLIMQWGRSAAITVGGQSVSFPIPFPTGVYSVSGTAFGANAALYYSIYTQSASGFTVWPAAGQTGYYFNWVAFGH